MHLIREFTPWSNVTTFYKAVNFSISNLRFELSFHYNWISMWKFVSEWPWLGCLVCKIWKMSSDIKGVVPQYLNCKRNPIQCHSWDGFWLYSTSTGNLFIYGLSTLWLGGKNFHFQQHWISFAKCMCARVRAWILLLLCFECIGKGVGVACLSYGRPGFDPRRLPLRPLSKALTYTCFWGHISMVPQLAKLNLLFCKTWSYVGGSHCVIIIYYLLNAVCCITWLVLKGGESKALHFKSLVSESHSSRQIRCCPASRRRSCSVQGGCYCTSTKQG